MARPIGLWTEVTRNPLAAAFAISLLIHVGLFGAYRVLPPSFVAKHGFLSRLLDRLTMSEKAAQKRLDEIKQLTNQKLFEEMLRRQQEMPMTFVEVDPALATEPPKEAKHYSTHDTRAANPEPQKQTKDPKIDGKETRMARLFDNPKPQPKPTPQPLQPFVPPKEPDPPAPAPAAKPPKEEKPPELRTDAKPNTKSEPAKPLETLANKTFEKTPDKPDLKTPGGEKVGDLAMAKPQPAELPNKAPGSGAPAAANPLITDPSPPPRHERPRTLAQAAQQNPMIAGRVMRQEGGVRDRGRVSIDAKGSPFGAYDAAFIAAVQERWYQLLEKNTYMLDRRGKVVLDFQLRYDGRITDMSVFDNSVGDVLALLCQRAVRDPAPYARWPGDMRRMVGADHREVRFTFYYD